MSQADEVQNAIAAMRNHLGYLQFALRDGEGFWKSDAERTVKLAENIRAAIAIYMGEDPT
jgi:hypothetical protein